MDDKLIAETIDLFTKNGWQVVSQSPVGVQFRKPRKVSLFLLILGLLTLPLLIGILFLVLAFSGKDRLEFVTLEQMRAGQAELIMLGRLPNP